MNNQTHAKPMSSSRQHLDNNKVLGAGKTSNKDTADSIDSMVKSESENEDEGVGREKFLINFSKQPLDQGENGGFKNEMDEDEMLLASDQAKKLTSRERRQLRNRVSARHFRLRRKEYVSQLEGLVSKMTAEINALETAVQNAHRENDRLANALKKASKNSETSVGNDVSAQHFMTSDPSTVVSMDIPVHQVILPSSIPQGHVYNKSRLVLNASNAPSPTSSQHSVTSTSTFTDMTGEMSPPVLYSHTCSPDDAPTVAQGVYSQSYANGFLPGYYCQPQLLGQIQSQQLPAEQHRVQPQHTERYTAVSHPQQYHVQQAGPSHDALISSNSNLASSNQPEHLELNLNISNLLPQYMPTSITGDVDWALNDTHNSAGAINGSYVNIPNAQIFNSFIPDLEKQTEHLSDENSNGADIEKSEEERLQLSIAAAEEVFKRLDVQMANLRF